MKKIHIFMTTIHLFTATWLITYINEQPRWPYSLWVWYDTNPSIICDTPSNPFKP